MAPPYRPRNLPVQSAARQPGLRWFRTRRPAGLRTRLSQSACKSEALRKLTGRRNVARANPATARRWSYRADSGELQAIVGPPAHYNGRWSRRDILKSCRLSAHSYRAQALPCHRTHLRAARRVWRTVVRATHTPLILVLPRPHPTATCVTMSSGEASGAGVMPWAEVAIVKAKPAMAINLSIVLLPWVAQSARGGFSGASGGSQVLIGRRASGRLQA